MGYINTNQGIPEYKLCCDWCEIELTDGDTIETIKGEFLCSGCDSKRLINEQ